MLAGAMRDGRICYEAKNDKCRQDGRYKLGGTTRPICKSSSNSESITILLHKFYCYLTIIQIFKKIQTISCILLK